MRCTSNAFIRDFFTMLLDQIYRLIRCTVNGAALVLDLHVLGSQLPHMHMHAPIQFRSIHSKSAPPALPRPQSFAHAHARISLAAQAKTDLSHDLAGESQRSSDRAVLRDNERAGKPAGQGR